MRLHALPLAASLLTPMFATAPAQANDGIANVSIGGVVFRKSDAIVMKKEVLSISHDLISVEHEFANDTGTEVEEVIVFPLPAYPAMQERGDTCYGRPAGFSIRADGRPVAYTTIACNPWFAPAIKEQPLTARQTRELDKLGSWASRRIFQASK